jgi:hypothetical protein
LARLERLAPDVVEAVARHEADDGTPAKREAARRFAEDFVACASDSTSE